MQNNVLKLFESYLLAHLPQSKSFHPYFEEALQDILKAGGKRFRPMLLLSVVNGLNPMLLQNAFSVAMAIEFLHTYSLIHDDLPSMDNADLRRGHPTLHKRFDEVTAILVGDALNTHAFNILSKAPLSNDIKIKLIETLSDDGGISGMIIGQAIDCYFENKKLNLEEVEFLHIHKTGKLIAASLKMGAIVCDSNQAICDDLYRFGIDLGLLFQIQDDILDVTQTDEIAGKTTHNDDSKNSFVTLMGLGDAIEAANALSAKCEQNLESMDNKIKNSLKPILDNYLHRHKSWVNKTQNILTNRQKFYKIWHSVFMSAN